MTKKTIFFSTLLLGALAGGSMAFATVGGPTYVYTPYFNSATNSVYYFEQDYGGRGCLPELLSLNVNTEATSILFSCDESEALLTSLQSGSSNAGGVEDYQAIIDSRINLFIDGLPTLESIDLNANGIEFEVHEVSHEKIDEVVMSRNFRIDVYQNGLIKDSFERTGCSPNEEFLFRGYEVPGVQGTLAILSSGKGNCFEGGYINEDFDLVSGLGSIESLATVISPKSNSALQKDFFTASARTGDTVAKTVVEGTTGSIVDLQEVEVSTVDEVVPEKIDPQTQPTERTSANNTIFAVVASLLIGVLLGLLLQKRRGSNE